MHADFVVGHLIDVGELHPHVVGVQHGVLSRRRYALPSQRQNVGKRLHYHQEVAVELFHLADGMLLHAEGQISGLVLHRTAAGQELRQELFAAHRPAAGSAASVGRGKCLVQIQMHHVKSHVSGPHNAHDGVQVGSVVVAEPARLVHDLGDFQNIFVKQTHRVGVGQHKSGRVLANCLTQLIQVHAAVLPGWDADHLVAAHGGAGRVGAVGGIRDNDLGPLLVPAVHVVCLDQQQAGELAVGARRGLKCHGVHARDLAQKPLRVPEVLRG